MYSVCKGTVRINSGLASLKEVQEMRMYTQMSVVLARTLSSRHEGFERTLSYYQMRACDILTQAPDIR
jgi:hypothetical protein